MHICISIKDPPIEQIPPIKKICIFYKRFLAEIENSTPRIIIINFGKHLMTKFIKYKLINYQFNGDLRNKLNFVLFCFLKELSFRILSEVESFINIDFQIHGEPDNNLTFFSI